MDNLQGNFIFLPALTIVQRAFNLSEATTTKDQSRFFSNFRWKLNYPSPWPHLCLLQDKHGPSSLLSCLAGPQTCLPPVGWQSRSRAPPCRPGPPHHQWQWSNLVQNSKLVRISYILQGLNNQNNFWCTSFLGVSYRVVRCHHGAVSCPEYYFAFFMKKLREASVSIAPRLWQHQLGVPPLCSRLVVDLLYGLWPQTIHIPAGNKHLGGTSSSSGLVTLSSKSINVAISKLNIFKKCFFCGNSRRDCLLWCLCVPLVGLGVKGDAGGKLFSLRFIYNWNMLFRMWKRGRIAVYSPPRLHRRRPRTCPGRRRRRDQTFE